MILLWVGFLFLIPRSAFALEPQLAVGYSIACLMREALWAHGETQVKCWGLGASGSQPGKVLAVPPLSGVTAVAASRAAACAIADHRVHCWGYDQDDQEHGLAARASTAFANLDEVVAIAGGRHSFCAVDWKQGVVCYDIEYDLKPTYGAINHGRAVGVGYSHACVIGEDRQPRCFETIPNVCRGDGFAKGVPTLVDPTEISVSMSDYGSSCRACVLDGGDLKCWGTSEAFDFPSGAPPTGLRHAGHLAQISLTQRGEDVAPCVLEEGKFLCRDKTGKLNPYDGYADLPGAVVFAGNPWANCAANQDTLKCFFGNLFEKTTVRVSHGIWFAPFALPELDVALDKMADESYADKKPIYRGAALQLRETIEKESLTGKNLELFRLFYLNALWPIVSNTDTELFDQFLKPNWKQLLDRFNSRHGIKQLRDLPVSSDSVMASLDLLRHCVSPLQGGFLKPEETERLNDFTAAIGIAIATRGSPSALADLEYRFEAIKPEIAALAALPRTSGIALAVRSLADYLK